MPLDVNKIIMESLEAINDNTTKEEVVTETATEEKKEEVVNETEEKKEEVVNETEEKKEEVVNETEEKKEEVVNETEEIDPMLNARVAAFAAGLGAVTLRKKLASYN
jgi:hypothetical protein